MTTKIRVVCTGRGTHGKRSFTTIWGPLAAIDHTQEEDPALQIESSQVHKFDFLRGSHWERYTRFTPAQASEVHLDDGERQGTIDLPWEFRCPACYPAAKQVTAEHFQKIIDEFRARQMTTLDISQLP